MVIEAMRVFDSQVNSRTKTMDNYEWTVFET